MASSRLTSTWCASHLSTAGGAELTPRRADAQHVVQYAMAEVRLRKRIARHTALTQVRDRRSAFA